jgi:predicted transcriptional regulator YdeE
MTHKIKQLNGFKIMGWKKHMTRYSEIHGMEAAWARHTAGNKKEIFNVELPASAANASEGFVYATGWLYDPAENIAGYEIIQVPGGRYAVFNVPDEYVDYVGDFKGKIHQEFLPFVGYTCDGVEIEQIKANNKITVSFLLAE